MERVIIRAKSRYSPESVVGTGNCTLPYFCDSGQGEKKVTVGSVSGGSVGLPETRTFFFWPHASQTECTHTTGRTDPNQYAPSTSSKLGA